MHPEKSLSRILSISLSAFVALVLTACGGGGGGGGTTQTQSIGGGGVKGPLANAIVTAYTFDSTAAGYKGAVIDTGTTDASAKITGLALTLPLAPPYILEFTSDAGTTDITTGMAPVITTMRTVLTQALIDTGEDVYATPLTTMATDLAVANAGTAAFGGDDTAPVTAAEFVAALPVAASQVSSTLGFGIDSTIDIFDTPPLVDDTTDTTGEQTSVAAYRAAVEAVTAVVYEMDQQNSGTTPDSVLSELTADLANDGDINGTTAAGASTVLTAATLEVLDQDPALLPIPNEPSGKTVGDVEQVLINETATTGTTTSTAELDPTTGSIDTVVKPAETNSDIDGDGVLNANDAFPTDPTEDTDTDGDGTGNNADTDDDNDGVPDSSDDFPLDASEHVDTDGDGIGNNADTDDDGDGVDDIADDFPLDPSASSATDVDGDGWPTGQDPDDADAANPGTAFVDTDGDGMADSGGAADDTDDDNDGVDDASDCAPLDASKNVDTDGDGTCDVDDSDDDNDGTPDTSDAFPLNNAETTDTDGDGIGNNADTDDDNDGVSDTQEGIDGTDPLLRDTDGDGFFDKSDAFPLDATEHVDTDSDGTGDNADTDDDNDGVLDTDEIANGTKPRVADTDGDGVGDGVDALPLDATETIDTDGDGIGNNADTDDDGDGLSDTDEATAGTDPLVTDSDSDGVNDGDEVSAGMNPLSNDSDSDTILDDVDNCPIVANTDQADSDGNGVGDVCDVDTDSDGVSDSLDNCPTMANADQANLDGDSMGDVCDADRDGDGHDNTADTFPDDATEWADSDGDGIGDNADPCPSDAANTCPVAVGPSFKGAVSVSVTTTAHTETTEPETGWCWSSQDEANLNVAQSEGYMPVKMDGGTITIDRDITGTLNTDGSFTASSIKARPETYWNGSSYVDITVTETLTVTGAATGAGFTATWSETQTSGSVLDCVQSGNVSGAVAYAPTGSEDYSSIYAVEGLIDEDPNGSSGAGTATIFPLHVSGTLQLELDAAAGTVNYYDAGYVVPISSNYDPTTGAFMVEYVTDEYLDDRDGGGTADDLVHVINNVKGVFIRAPGSAQAEMWVQEFHGVEYVYYNTSTYNAGLVADETNEDAYISGFGKMVTTAAYNRAFTNPNGSGTVNKDIIGLMHPPMKTAAANSELWFEAYAGTDTTVAPLCSTSFWNGGLVDRADLPESTGFMRPDITSETILSTPYSYVKCNLAEATVSTGSTYTLVVRDDHGTPGDTSDDTETPYTYTAQAVATYPGVKQDRRSLNFNGATMSSTETGGHIIVNGYFNPTQDIPVSWPMVSGADGYSLKLWNFDPSTVTLGDQQWRISTSPSGGATESVSIKAKQGLELYENVVAARLQARYNDGSGNYAYSQSKFALLKPGLNGAVDVEMLEPGVGPMIFQVAVRTDLDGAVSCKFTQTGGDDCQLTEVPPGSTNWEYGNIDYATNIVTLHTTAGDLQLTFSDAVHATATLGAASGNALVVKQELVAKTRIRPNGTQSTQLYLTNPIPGFAQAGVVDAATGGTNFATSLWDNTIGGATGTEGYFGKVFQFFASDWDGTPAINGTAASFDSNTTTGAVLADATYAAGMTGHTAGLNDRTFKVSYAYADPTSLVPPTPPNVSINGTGAGGSQNVGTPFALSGAGITSVSWVSASPADSEWQVMIRGVDGSGNDIPGQDIRTSWMSSSHTGLSFDAGTNTWTWTNPDGIPADIWSNGMGKIILRVRPAGDGDIQGIGPSLYVTP